MLWIFSNTFWRAYIFISVQQILGVVSLAHRVRVEFCQKRQQMPDFPKVAAPPAARRDPAAA